MMLSVLIPARNEMFLARTVQDLLTNIRGDTEIIVVLDGAWADPGLPQDPRLTVVYLPESVGQRAATNIAARLSSAKYLMKVDAHCAFDEGFDTKMLEAIAGHDDWTMAPLMRNLHIFDWVCPAGHRRYQGPSGPCAQCGQPVDKDIVWVAKPSPRSTAYCFDSTPHFQYHGEQKRKTAREEISESMSLQGSCWMLTRERYWALNICDEKLGSWGSQGIEVACKTWLSGGAVMVNKKTWYAHMFRTQGKDFGFPYKMEDGQVDAAKKGVRELFFKNTWNGATRPLAWLVRRFWPVPGWSEADLAALDAPSGKGIIYYTDNRLPVKLAKRVQGQIEKSGLPIVSCSIRPMPHFGRNVHLPGERGPLQMFRQILAAIEASTAETLFFCEHDVLYHQSHFDFVPPKKGVWYYNTNVWKVDIREGNVNKKMWRVDDCRQVSGICVDRETALTHYRTRVARVEADGYSAKMGYEPGTHGRPERVDDATSERWESEHPNIDLRHDGNLSHTKTGPEDFRNPKYAEGWRETNEVPGWGKIEF